MRFVPTPIASKLTGLSTAKLREWTRRRALVPADVRPKRKGSPAKFSWQTILVLRIAVLLRDRFCVELQPHKASFEALRDELRDRSFLSLWGSQLALCPGGSWVFFDAGGEVPDTDALLIAFDPHLAVLREGFALPDANHAQLDLFSLPAVRGARAARNTSSLSGGARRSA